MKAWAVDLQSVVWLIQPIDKHTVFLCVLFSRCVADILFI